MKNSMLDLVTVNENVKERQITANVTVLDISKLTQPALVPAREGDIIKEEVDGVLKEYQLTKETAVGKKVPMDRFSVTFSYPSTELVGGVEVPTVKQRQFFMLRNMLPADISNYAGKKANVTTIKEVLTEERVNINNPDIKHPAGTVFINCIKLEFMASTEEDLMTMFAKLMSNRPTM